jgi:hypothetical protein
MKIFKSSLIKCKKKLTKGAKLKDSLLKQAMMRINLRTITKSNHQRRGNIQKEIAGLVQRIMIRMKIIIQRINKVLI